MRTRREMVGNSLRDKITFEGFALYAFIAEITVAVARLRGELPDFGQERALASARLTYG